MLDTLKIKIPLSAKQHKRLTRCLTSEDRPQWVLFHPKTGEIDFLRCKGLAETDQHSYHRHILFDVPMFYVEAKTCLTCEFSLPKYWYGHNISLLYDWMGALLHFKRCLESRFGLTPKNRCDRLPDPASWELHRADFCYAFQFPNQKCCHQYLESLKHIHYPRKYPTIHPTSIQFHGSTYSFKIYEKQPEFKAHDARELRKAKANPDWIAYLENKAGGVLRCEATLRRKYLKVNGINTVGDLHRSGVEVSLSADWLLGYYGRAALNLLYHLYCQSGELDPNHFESGFTMTETDSDIYTLTIDEDGNIISMLYGEQTVCDHEEYETFIYLTAGRTATLEKIDLVQSKLNYFLEKFLGGHSGMLDVDQVQIKLSEVYKPVKVARLTAFWLYVRRFGTKKARDDFGHDSYYASKRDLKNADVSLLEPAENVIPIDKDFMSAFKMRVPSEHVVNRVDDFRDGDNLLNLPNVGNQ